MILSLAFATIVAARAAFTGNDLAFLWNDPAGAVMFGRALGEGAQIGTGNVTSLVAGDGYLATWNGTAARIARDGHVVEAVPVTSPNVTASNGSSFLIVEQRPSSMTSTIFGATPVVLLPATEFDQVPLALAWNGDHYLLVYDQFFGPHGCKGCVPNFERRAVVLDLDGRATGASLSLGTEFYYGYEPRVAVAGGDGLFAIATGHTLMKTTLAIVDSNGNVVAGTSIDPDPRDATFDGANFVIAGVLNGAGVIQKFDRSAVIREPRVEIPLAFDADFRLAGSGASIGALVQEADGVRFVPLSGPRRHRAAR